MKKLVVLGAQESGVGAARLAQQQGFDVFVSDAGEIKPKYRDELKRNAIAFEEGGHTEARVLLSLIHISEPTRPY